MSQSVILGVIGGSGLYQIEGVETVAEQSGLDAIDVQLTYLQLETYERREDCRTFASDELAAFCADLIERYLHWVRIYQQWCAERDLALEEFKFPFAEFRPGQRDLAAATYRTIDGRGRAFAQAPTGIGKTISTLFPAAKALGLGHAEKIFYLTAKTSGRRVAEKAIDALRGGGARLKSLTLTARDKICFKPSAELRRSASSAEPSKPSTSAARASSRCPASL